MAAPSKIPWIRYWAPHGRPAVHALGSEFLPDPDDIFGGSNQHLIRTTDLAKAPFAILGGEPGIGKSTELAEIKAQLEAEGKSVLAVHCRQFPDTATFVRQVLESDQWKRMEVNQEHLALLIDGVDEGFVTLPRFIPFLTAELKDRDISRLQLMLACRTAHWPFADGSQLAALWPSSGSQDQSEEAGEGVFELARLRIEDVRAAAVARGIDPEKFLEEVEDKNVAALAAQPVTLFFLLEEFSRSQSLPATRLEIYEKGIRHLCEEPDLRRTEELRRLSPGLEIPSVEQAYRVAARIASMITVGAKAAIFVGRENEAANADLHHTEIIGGTETAADIPFQVTPHFVQETLRRPLFESKGVHRTGFLHQTFAEFLTARYLVPLSITQLRQLLCQEDGGEEAIIPQLQEVATWLATLHEEWRGYLLDHHTEALLRSDPSSLADVHKMKLVEQLIKRITEGQVFGEDYSTEFLRGICYAGFADRLRPLITDRDQHRFVREFALAAASQCKLEALAAEVRAVCVDPLEEDGIRRRAGDCLVHVLPDDRLDELIPFATGEQPTDSEDACKGYAIQALVPKKWRLEDALPHLSDPQRPNHIDEYYWLLSYYLPRFVTPENAVTVLGFVAEKPGSFSSFGRSNWFDPLGTKALHTALSRLEDPRMATAVSDLWLRKTREDKSVFTDGEDGTLHVLQTESEKRRKVLGSILNNVGLQAKDFANLHHELLRTEDFGWLLSKIASAPPGQRTFWARSIHDVSTADNLRQHWDRLLQQMSDVPELEAAFAADFTPRVLGSPEAQREREAWIEDQNYVQEVCRRMELRRPNPKAAIEAALATTGADARWIAVNGALQTDRSGDNAHDPSQSPAWSELSDKTKEQICEAARQFLIDAEAPSVWSDRRHPHRLPAYRAAWLVRAELRTQPDLENAVRTKWLSVLLDYPAFGQAHHQETVAFLMDRQPERCLAWLGEKLAHENAHQMPSAQFFRSFGAVWTSRISDLLVQSFQNESVSIDLRLGIFHVLLLNDLDRAVALLLDQICSKRLEDIEADAMFQTAIAEAVVQAPTAVWSELWPRFQGSDPLTRAVFRRVHNLPQKQQRRLTELTPTQMQELYLLLDRNFPDDPQKGDLPADAHMLRSDLLKAITGSGTEEGCQALRRLAAAQPENSPWIMRGFRECLVAKRRKDWRPPAPKVIRGMVRDRVARFVENADALQEAVLESLERFQSYLIHSELPGVSHLWNYEKRGQHRTSFAPKDEEDLSDEVCRWLMRDLAEGKAVILNREVQIRRGQRLDILVQAILPGCTGTLTCIVEVKGCWNPGLRNAISTQLAKDYLEANGHTHGIYLVGWFLCDRWDRKHDGRKVCLTAQDFDSAVKEVEELAAPFDGIATRIKIRGVLLDCRHHEQPSKDTAKNVTRSPKKTKVPKILRKPQTAKRRAAR